MGAKQCTNKQQGAHMDVGHSPTCGTNAMHPLLASNVDMVSGFPTTCCPHHIIMAESVIYAWCFGEAPIILQNLPFLLKGVAQFKKIWGPILAKRLT